MCVCAQSASDLMTIAQSFKLKAAPGTEVSMQNVKMRRNRVHWHDRRCKACVAMAVE
jgi:hypothetical protein